MAYKKRIGTGKEVKKNILSCKLNFRKLNPVRRISHGTFTPCFFVLLGDGKITFLLNLEELL
jgi:hypothetical protein